jgi:hypothetical protein
VIVFGGLTGHLRTQPTDDLLLITVDPVRPLASVDRLATNVAEPAPGARYGHLGVRCGPAQALLIVHGGANLNGTTFADTWALVGDVRTPHWQRIAEHGPQPPRRIFHSGACLPSGQLVFFGGCKCEPSCVCFDDVWLLSWTGGSEHTPLAASWQRIESIAGSDGTAPGVPGTTAPHGRYRHGLVMTAHRSALLLVGGESYVPYRYYADTWELRYPGQAVGAEPSHDGLARTESAWMWLLGGAAAVIGTGMVVLVVRRRQRAVADIGMSGVKVD